MLSDLSIALRSLNQALQRGELKHVGLEAIALYDQTLSLDALQLARQAGDRALHAGRFSLAIDILAAIVQRDPHQHIARCHLGMTQLSIGEFEPGWTNYDDRPTRRGFIQDMRRLQPRIPLWDGNLEAIAGLNTGTNSGINSGINPDRHTRSEPFKLLVMAEQGFGDAIQFSRYVPLLIDRGIHVTLGCRPPLAKLLATLPQFDADRLLLPGQTPPPLNAFTLLMSLPGVFRTTIDTIPQAVPYLKPGALSAAGRDLLISCGLGSALRVGIVWSGSATRDRDDERSCGLDVLLPLLNLPNVTFFSLQKDPSPRDRQRLLSLGVIDLDPFLLDFSDTAAFITELDLVISVDTAVVHLAGALGKPVWVLLAAVADWRWLTDREDSPWYPQARLFRQQLAGDWRSVVVALRQALAKLIRDNEPDFAGMDDAAADPVTLPPIEPATSWFDPFDQTSVPQFQPRPISSMGNLFQEIQEVQEIQANPKVLEFQNIQAVQAQAHGQQDIQTELQATIAAFQNQDFDTATQLCDRLLRLPLPHQTAQQLAILRGSIAYQCHDLPLAVHWFQRSITLDPQSLSSQLNLGNTYRDLGQTQAALNCYAQAEAIAPVGSRSEFDVRWERSLALLQAGQWRDGFADYEARLDRKPWPPHIQRNHPPQWDGVARPHCTLILRMSQGYGDAIQAVRYVPWLKQQGTQGLRIVLESRLPLTRLLQTLEGVDAIVNVGEPLPAGDSQHDHQAFLMSLPHLCRTTIDTVPAGVPYLRSPGWRDESTRQTVADLLDRPSDLSRESGSKNRSETDPPIGLNPDETKPSQAKLSQAKPYKIGVIWSGSPTHAQDFRRSIPLQEFAALFEIASTHDDRPVQFYSLQTDVRDRDRAQFDQLCATGRLVDLGSFIRDFGDTAHLLTQLDLTIAVDTSVIHLAGALAKPAWVLLSAAPDWRWLRDRCDTPWYPTVRLFRQNHLGNWHIALDKVRYAIENGTELQTPLRCDDAAKTEF
jgi:tetratricopeptide (TPR) repeat protein